MNTIPVEYPEFWQDYMLIDSGDGEKLEQFGQYSVVRPDPRAIWRRAETSSWDRAGAHFIRTDSEHGDWNVQTEPPNPWTISYRDMTFILKPTDFKHVGIFPEQAVNWDFLQKTIHGDHINVLNLFGYTGAASVAMAKTGAAVTHVDSSKTAITWANENIQRNGLSQAGTRWILDDVNKFVARELKRGNRYEGIVLDPPRFGRGTKGEVWKLLSDLPLLLETCAALLSDTARFLLVNAYTADISAIALGNLLSSVTREKPGTVTYGEIAIKEHSRSRLLPHGIVGRWTSEIIR